MNKKWLFIVILQVVYYLVFAQNSDVTAFTESFFADEEYQIITSKFEDTEVHIAINFREPDSTYPPKGQTFSKGLLFYLHHGSPVLLLRLVDNCIYYGNGELYFNGDYLPTLLAWEIRLTNTMLYFTRHGINGNITDPIRFVWNNEKLLFENFVVDTSQY